MIQLSYFTFKLNFFFLIFEKLLELKLTKRDEIWKIQFNLSSLLVARGGWSVVEEINSGSRSSWKVVVKGKERKGSSGFEWSWTGVEKWYKENSGYIVTV